MEKKEAVREYCIERAMEIEKASLVKITLENVLKTAQKLEKYIIE